MDSEMQLVNKSCYKLQQEAFSFATKKVLMQLCRLPFILSRISKYKVSKLLLTPIKPAHIFTDQKDRILFSQIFYFGYFPGVFKFIYLKSVILRWWQQWTTSTLWSLCVSLSQPLYCNQVFLIFSNQSITVNT